MTHCHRWSLPRRLIDLERGRGAAYGRRLLSQVPGLRHLRRIIIRHGCSDTPGLCHPVASRPRTAVPFMIWDGVARTAAEYLRAPAHPPATVVTCTSGKGVVPANDGVSFHASATTPSRAVAVF